jgi:hypothetical protein
METSTCSHVFALDCAAERSIRVRAYRLFLFRGCAGYGAFGGGPPGGNFRGRGYLLRLFRFFGLSITTCLTLCHHPAPASTAAKATATLHSVGAFRRTVAIYFSTAPACCAYEACAATGGRRVWNPRPPGTAHKKNRSRHRSHIRAWNAGIPFFSR